TCRLTVEGYSLSSALRILQSKCGAHFAETSFRPAFGGGLFGDVADLPRHARTVSNLGNTYSPNGVIRVASVWPFAKACRLRHGAAGRRRRRGCRRPTERAPRACRRCRSVRAASLSCRAQLGACVRR